MNKNQPAIDFAPDAVYSTHPLWLIWSAAVMVLLLLLGHDSLLYGEGALADGLRRLMAGEDIFANWWHEAGNVPLWSCRFRGIFSGIWGVTEFSCRLPSVISALFLLGGTMVLTNDFFDRKVMCITAWMLIGSCGFIYWGRFADTFITLAAWGIWSAILLRNARDYFWWRGLFFLMLWSGTVWWGIHYLLLLPGLLVMNMVSCQRALFRVKSLIAAGFALLIVMGVLVWMVDAPGAALGEYPFRVWTLIESVFADSLRETFYSGGNFYMGWGNLLLLLLPWGLPVAVAVAGMFWQWRELSADQKRLLLGTVFLFFFGGLFPGCSWQYQLPQLPFFLMLGAAGIAGEAGVPLWQEKCNQAMKWIASLFCSLAVSVIATWPLWEMIFFAPPSNWIIFVIPFLGVLGLAMLIFDTGSLSVVERASGMHGPWSGYILAWVCFMTAVLAVGKPALTDYRSGKSFWLECGRNVSRQPAKEVIFWGSYPAPEALFYLNMPESPVRAAENAELAAALAAITTGEAKMIILQKDYPQLQEMLARQGWQLESQPLIREDGAISFSAETASEAGKFAMYRAWKSFPQQ